MSTHQPVKDRLTIVTTTHLLPSAPRVAVLKGTVNALRKRMNVAGCRHLVYYDQPADRGPREAKYLANLQRLCDQYSLELNVRPQSGLKKNLLEALDQITTPYIFFLEHDWAIKRTIPLETLLDVFDKYNFVNHVRFNMRNNDSYFMWDHLVEPEDRITELMLTRTSAWSNQAHIARVSKWRQDWLKVDRSGTLHGLFWRRGKALLGVQPGYLHQGVPQGTSRVGPVSVRRYACSTVRTPHGWVDHFRQSLGIAVQVPTVDPAGRATLSIGLMVTRIVLTRRPRRPAEPIGSGRSRLRARGASPAWRHARPSGCHCRVG